jgi:hypothetical protein
MTGDQALRKEWDAISYDGVGLWRHLLRYGFGLAAWGLLMDLLRELWRQEHDERPAGVAMRNRHREFLMEVLGDQDGRNLRAVLDGYAQHRAEHEVLPPTPSRDFRLDLFEHVVSAMDVLQAEECEEDDDLDDDAGDDDLE